jgi:AbrB family looped-hinge helix DNA binding protein
LTTGLTGPPASIGLLYDDYHIDGGIVETVTISPKYQVVIPKRVRRKLGLTPGQKVQAIVYENRIELVLVRPVRKLRGFLKGIDTRIDRDDDRL